MILSDGALRRLWWAVVVAEASLFLAGYVLHFASRNVGEGSSWGSAGLGPEVAFGLITLLFPVAGVVIGRAQLRNRIGWVLLLIGASWALDVAFTGFATFAWLGRHRLVGASQVAVTLDQWTWIPAIGLTGTFLLLLFPEGRLPSPRWRWVAWAAGVAIAFGIAASTLAPGTATGTGFPAFRNPLGIDALHRITPFLYASIAVIPLAMVASAASIVIRFRRSRGVERLQVKWLAAAAATVALLYLVAMASTLPFDNFGNRPPPHFTALLQDAALYSFGLIPVAVGIAVLKHRLYDIDVVINKALVYGALAAFITAMYVAIVVGIGAAVGQGSSPNLGLSIVATAIVALSFGAVRERVQRLANRLVYGKRATPYEALSEFSTRMTGSYATDDLLPRITWIMAEATGADRAEVWLRLGSRLVREASWPADEVAGTPVSVPMPDPGVLPEIVGVQRGFPVSHQGELLGALTLRKPRGDPLTPADEKITTDLAAQAGLVLRNVRLVEDLKASRQRIVAAQDEERRRLERDIHDGAQQDLVTIALATKLAAGRLPPETDPKARELLDQASEELGAALSELRELARGIHPAVLTEQGLPAALESLAERSTVPATVRATVSERLDPTVEATAYFAVSEALQNVAKYAKASSVRVTAERMDGHLVVEVRDDGLGGADASKGSGLRGLFDRVSAVGGELAVDSPPGAGTAVIVRLPASG